ncbi:hypothetical protein MKW92_004926 [Papaver armeniacum]|nr:hypothetical protein MKW92_004926 [Papaver armeniacum]
MKFEKELWSHMVPEWQAAYMDYTSLKAILEDFKLFKLRNPHQNEEDHHHNGGVAGVYRTFSGLLIARSIPSVTNSSKVTTSTSNLSPPATTTTTTNRHHHHHHHGIFHHEEPTILVHRVAHRQTDHDLEHGGPDAHHENFETKLLKPDELGGEFELAFFRRLDEEFNKVNNFYRDKVDQVMNEAAVLTKQMDALVAFRVKVEHPESDQGKFEQLCREIAKSASAFSFLSPVSSKTELAHMDAIEESNERSISNRGNRSEESELSENGDCVDGDQSNKQETCVNEEPDASINEILNSVTINKIETPVSTIKAILNKNRNNNEGLRFNIQNLRKVEEQLKSAFVNFYHKLQLLKNYSYLNLLAFSKTMKRYDKITSRHASKIYLNMVDNSYIGSSDDVSRLMDRVESSFIKHFSKSNRGKGMHILRSKKKKERHSTTFSSGFFFGCTISLLICLILVINVGKIFKKQSFTQYMDTMFPLYSLFGFLVLHMLLYSANIYFWRRYRVNYPFIFEFKQGTELGYREVFLLSTILASLASVLANLNLEIDHTATKYKPLKELLPLALVSAVLLITFCPFNIVFRSSRIFLLRTTLHCLSAPLYKVSLSDFMLADRMSSQGQALRNVAFYICYYASGDYKTRETSCKTNNVYNSFYIMLGAFPFWLRALQYCPGHSYDNRLTESTIQQRLLVLAWICSTVATIVAIYWDLVLDWGLLRKNSKNPWLRDKLLVSYKMLNIQLPFLHKEAMVTVVACLEIIRRGVWNFFRIENEHVNNVGKFRAFTKVPLPFNYDEDDKDD